MSVIFGQVDGELCVKKVKEDDIVTLLAKDIQACFPNSLGLEKKDGEDRHAKDNEW